VAVKTASLLLTFGVLKVHISLYFTYGIVVLLTHQKSCFFGRLYFGP